jgi:hypothetical protein
MNKETYSISNIDFRSILAGHKIGQACESIMNSIDLIEHELDILALSDSIKKEDAEDLRRYVYNLKRLTNEITALTDRVSK